MLAPHKTLADEKVLAILSPNNLRHLEQIKTQLGIVFPLLQVVAPKSLEHLREVVSFNARKYGVLISVGGDGTLHRVINAADLKHHILGILPCGTGNDFARMLNFPLGLKAAIIHLQSCTPQATDYCTAGSLRYHTCAGFGIDSATLKLRQDHPGGLNKNYNIAFLRALARLECPPLKIEYGQTTIESPCYWVLGMNGREIGGGTKIAPKARLDDGLLDMVVLKETSKLQLIMMLPSAIRGKHLSHPSVEYAQVGEFTCTQETPITYLAVDGEVYYYGEKSVKFKCCPFGMTLLR